MSDPSVISSVVTGMQSRASVVATVDGGTEAMRAAGKIYLPIWPQEDELAWKSRLVCTVLFPAVTKALNTMTGYPFEEPIVLGVDVPASIVPHTENIDNAGRDLDTFAKDVLRASIRDGIGWILVDYPLVSQPFANLAEERAAKVRPYWVHVPLSRMIGWRSENVGGAMRVTQVRFSEDAEVPDGDFGTRSEERIRVIEPNMVRVYRKTQNGWELAPDLSGPTTMAEVPMVPIYTGRTGFWTALPPLSDLAWVNVQHWQSSSDQRNILHCARVPLLAADQDQRTSQDDGVSLKAGGIILGLANLRYVEHSGAAITSGRQDILDLEDQMRRIVGELLDSENDRTATEIHKSSSEGNAWLKSVCKGYEDALEECLRLHAAWMKEAQGGSLVVNTEWDEETLSAQMFQALTQARSAGTISQETYTYNLQGGGILPPDRTVEQEVESINSEGPQAFGQSIE